MAETEVPVDVYADRVAPFSEGGKTSCSSILSGLTVVELLFANEHLRHFR